MACQGVKPEQPGPRARPGLLLLFAPAGHVHRDAVCATLAWIAAAEGLAFECYYEGAASGVHFGGGLPWNHHPADLRGGTFSGGHHLEQLALTIQRFDCQAACLGPTIFDALLRRSRVPIRATSSDVVEFYGELFASGSIDQPTSVLAIGAAGPINLVPYACHEVVRRKVLAVAADDPGIVERLGRHYTVEHLWPSSEAAGPQVVADRSLEQAAMWSARPTSYLLGDPELAGRWIPSAVRHGWAPLYGIPQADVVRRLGDRLDGVDLVWGRQQDDSDFLELSRRGVAFQLADPGRPPFPVIANGLPPTVPANVCTSEPADEELRRWARDGEFVASIVFWSGMVRELECLYALTDLVAASGVQGGLAMTTEALRYFDSSPLGLLATLPTQAGLAGRLEVLIASAGAGGMIESASPLHRFSATLRRSVDAVRGPDGSPLKPAGWWAVMDAPLLPRAVRRVRLQAWPPGPRVRYRRRPLEAAALDAHSGSRRRTRLPLRTRVRESPLGGVFEPIRPFDDRRPGGPLRGVLEAVRDAGFEYALTKSEFGAPPTVVTGVTGLTAVNYTAGRWDGWTPFETINSLGDLAAGERRLRRAGRPGWLLGGIDTCLWAFSGHVLDRGPALREMCRWLAAGGASGRLHNVTPRTLSRYARILAELGVVRTVPAG